jgi:hypothetical protein
LKFFLFFILTLQVSFAQVSTRPEPFPSEGSAVVPDLVRPDESAVEGVVHEALAEEKSDSLATRIEKKMREIKNTKHLREESTGSALVGYQFITSWLPSKISIGYTHILNRNWSLDGEYSWASIKFPVVGIDLGEVTEKRFSLQALRYLGNSFHFSFGATLNDFKARLGSDTLDSLGNEITSSFQVQNVGVTGGTGNRWQWENGLTLGIDWFRINIPVVETKLEDQVLDEVDDSSDQSDIEKIIRTLNRVPTFVLFGLKIGYTF